MTKKIDFNNWKNYSIRRNVLAIVCGSEIFCYTLWAQSHKSLDRCDNINEYFQKKKKKKLSRSLWLENIMTVKVFYYLHDYLKYAYCYKPTTTTGNVKKMQKKMFFSPPFI